MMIINPYQFSQIGELVIPYESDLLLNLPGKGTSNYEISDVNKVDKWIDASANGNDLVDVSNITRPTYNNNGIALDGTELLKNATPNSSRDSITEGTWFCVAKRTGNNGVIYGMSYSSGSTGTDSLPIFQVSEGNKLKCQAYDSLGTTITVEGSITTDETFIGILTWDGVTMKLYINGILTDTASGVTMSLGTLAFDIIGTIST